MNAKAGEDLGQVVRESMEPTDLRSKLWKAKPIRRGIALAGPTDHQKGT